MSVDQVAQAIEREWISVRRLKQSLDGMRESGFWPPRVEVGPQTFEVLVNYTISLHHFSADGEEQEEARAQAEGRMRLHLMKGMTNMEFNGMPVVMCDDVPEGTFWPSREKSPTRVRPFKGSEAEHENNPYTR